MNRKLIPVFLIVLVDIFGLMLILPLLPIYAEKMGASPFVAGLLVSAYAACQLVASPILGQLSDRWGRKPILLISQVGTLAGFVLLAAADTLTLVFLSRVIDGFTAGNISVANAYISDVSEPRHRARAFGLVGIAFGIGFVIAPALAGFLASHGPRFPIYAAIAASAASILATAVLLPGRRAGEAHTVSDSEARGLNPAAFAAAFRNKPLAVRLLQFVLFSLAFSGFFAGFPLFAERHYTYGGVPFGVREVGLALTILGISGIPTQLFLLPASLKKFGEKALISYGYIGTAAGFALLAVREPLWMLVVAIGVMGVSSALLRPSLVSLITQHVAKHEQGMIMGLVQSLLSVCQIIAPMVGGVLIGAGLLKTWAFLAAVLTMLGWAVGRMHRRSGAVITG